MKIRGFTLIEAILAVAFLAAGLAGLLVVFESAVASSLLADQTYVALNLAREAAETILAKRDCNLAGCGYASTLSAIQGGSYNQSPVSGFSIYNLTVTATEVDPGSSTSTTNFTTAQSGSGYASIKIVVSFNNGANSVQLTTLMANY
jgi:Tfp pilus assembly protein PilV